MAKSSLATRASTSLEDIEKSLASNTLPALPVPEPPKAAEPEPPVPTVTHSEIDAVINDLGRQINDESKLSPIHNAWLSLPNQLVTDVRFQEFLSSQVTGMPFSRVLKAMGVVVSKTVVRGRVLPRTTPENIARVHKFHTDQAREIFRRENQVLFERMDHFCRGVEHPFEHQRSIALIYLLLRAQLRLAVGLNPWADLEPPKNPLEEELREELI